MEIVARRLGEALTGEVIESAVAPGINALKTFDPPLSALDGADDRGRAPARQAADARRRRPDPADAPDERRPPPAVPQARHHARPHGARGPAAVRGPRAAAARVRHQAARVGEAPHPRRGRRRRGAQPPGAGGVARSARPRRAAARAAAAAHAAARPVRRDRDRAHLGRRDPARRDALALQARRRSLGGGGRAAARGDGLRARPRR